MPDRNLEKLHELGDRLGQDLDLLDTFFELATDLFAIATPAGYFVRLSKSWEYVLGWTREELMSRPFTSFLDDTDYGKTTQEINKIREEGEIKQGFRNHYVRKDGSIVELEWKSTKKDDLIYAVARVVGP